MRDFSSVIDQCQLGRAAITLPLEAKRLFHGRGHCYPGFEDLTVDWLAGVILVGSFGDDAEGAARLTDQLAEQLADVSGAVVQLRRGRATRGEIIAGTVPEELQVEEAGLRYLVRPMRNQNVGLFLDMAPTRQWIRQRAQGKRVLNLFAYTCAFSVAAVAGGASCVVNNDMSRPALDWGKENHALNDQDPRSVRMVPHNVFKSWWKLRQYGPYDLVVIDPPTNQRGSFVAEKHYAGVLKRLNELCAPGADVLACLNSPFLNADFVPQLMTRWAPGCRFVDFLPVSADFPDQFPDRGLKISHYRSQ
jgi:23S rRNA (cytosine1962-C5)-methyltransferase